MKDDKNLPENSPENDNGGGSRLIFYIGAAAFATGLVLLILAFTVKSVGTTGLIFSMVSELAGVSLANAQLRTEDFTLCRVLKIACYVVMAAAFLAIVAGIIVISTQ